MSKTKYLRSLVIAGVMMSSSAQAVSILGAGLQGNDLTDPENNANQSSLTGYDAIFRSSHESQFNSEGAFNVFDNTVGSGDAKWCCDGPTVWVEADFGSQQYDLTSFTITSGNDASNRDPDQWSISGSNDGINYDAIFSYANDSLSPFSGRNQTLLYTGSSDTFAMGSYSIFRYEATSVVAGGTHQINELEFFGTEAAVPEPSIIALFGVGLAGLWFARRRQA
jgi:hypothetical protein